MRAFAQSEQRPIGFLTDFDTKDDAVGICHAVMHGIAPTATIIDITHQVTPFDIAEGARFLAGSAPYFAKDAVFVAVVDPGVGTTRKAIIVKSKVGQYFVLPDNGLITGIAERDGLEAAREITNTGWMIGARLSSTFHGRDIFSPAAAHLARGDNWKEAGPEIPVSQLSRLQGTLATLDEHGLHAEVIGTDGPFGNLVLNVPQSLFVKLGYSHGDVVRLKLNGRDYHIPFVRTFNDVPVGTDLLYIDSRDRLSIATNQGNLAERDHIERHMTLEIPHKR
jgi:S-adenosylmethionine hydrolase